MFYTPCIRSILTYEVPVFHCALPLYLQGDLERVEGRALSIICAGLDYKEALDVTDILTIPTIKFHTIKVSATVL